MTTDLKPLVLRVLQDSYAIMQDPDRIVTGRYATDRDGKVIEPESLDAYCFCSVGVINHFAYHSDPRNSYSIRWHVKQLLLKAIWEIFPDASSIIDFHDDVAQIDPPTFLRAWARAVDIAQQALKEHDQ